MDIRLIVNKKIAIEPKKRINIHPLPRRINIPKKFIRRIRDEIQ